MHKFIENATKNLLSNSVEKNDYKKAKKEWYFTDEVIDNSENFEIDETRPSCELCKHEDLRWQFIIKNRLNNNQLMVGSTCIKQFDIGLIDEYGHIKYGEERDSNIEKAINKKRTEAEFNNVLEALRNLWKKDKGTEWEKDIERCGKEWKEEKSLQPNHLAFIVYRFNENNINYKKLILKINMRKEKYRDQIIRMEKWKYLLIRTYVNSKYYEYYDKHFQNK
ncbi:MAG: hypothetical protein LBE74_07415 [Treponema sp.]|jgi:DNA polymerase III delta prime subunit|nr:hypothetical protein [Treponema sp.]